MTIKDSKLVKKKNMLANFLQISWSLFVTCTKKDPDQFMHFINSVLICNSY